MRSSFTMTKVNKDRFPWDWPQKYNYQRDRFPRDCPSHPEIHFLISGIRALFLGQWRLLQRHTCRFKMYKVTFSGWMEKITWGEVWRSWWTCRGQKRSMQIQHSGLLQICKVKIVSERQSNNDILKKHPKYESLPVNLVQAILFPKCLQLEVEFPGWTTSTSSMRTCSTPGESP